MHKLNIYNQEGKSIDTLELDTEIFNAEINSALLHQVAVMYQANTRRGCHSTKTRAYVSGGGKKPWRQKGTGRARVGSNRSPLWRHGGIIFGPHPRSYVFNLPAKIKARAFQSSINARLKENAVIVLDTINTEIKKTKEINQILKNLKLAEKCLFILDDTNKMLRRPARNIPLMQIKDVNSANALDILMTKKILLAKKTFMDLANRIKKSLINYSRIVK